MSGLAGEEWRGRTGATEFARSPPTNPSDGQAGRGGHRSPAERLCKHCDNQLSGYSSTSWWIIHQPVSTTRACNETDLARDSAMGAMPSGRSMR